jgi:hypothetical protein
MSAHCSIIPSVNYFVVMEDFGRKGRQAQPDPELTRANIVDRIRTKQYGQIAFIHHIHADGWDDVTNELLHEAGFYSEPTEHDRIMSRFDQLIAQIDHDRDVRKHI